MKKAPLLLLLILLMGCGGGGGGVSSTVNGALPVATLSMASTVTENSAILNGSVIPNGLPTECWFEYGTDPSLAAYDNSARQTVGSGIASQAVTWPLNGLSPGTTYRYRICASNSLGMNKSSVAAFTTSSSGTSPVTYTLAANLSSPTGVTLNASVTPNGLATNAWFEWGTDPFLDVYSTTSTQYMGSGSTSQFLSAWLNGLSIGTTYYCRVAAANSSGTSRGAIVSFRVGLPPYVITLAANSITATGATLNAYVIPNGLETTTWFTWGTDPALVSYETTSTQSAGSGMLDQLVSVPLEGLSTGTTYYFRIYASNSSGTSWGTIVSFTPGSAPSVTTLAATSVSGTSAMLNGSVSSSTSLPATDAWFEWGTDPALASYDTTPVQSGPPGMALRLVGCTLTGLSTGTTYYFRFAVSTGSDILRGEILNFMPATAPSATTRGATSISGAGATLNGEVTPNGMATTAWFEWGTDPALSGPNATDAQNVGSGTTAVPVSQPIGGLADNTTYYFRVVSQNGAGTSRGRIGHFYVATSGAPQKCVTYQIDTAHSGRAVFDLPLVFPSSPTWRITLVGAVSYPLIANGKVYVVTRGSSTGGYGNQLYALDLATGEVAWGPVAITGSGFWSGHAYENGKIFVVNYDGLLRSFDAANGTPGWSTSLPYQRSFSAPPTAANGIVYTGGAGSGGTLYAVDEQNGALLWTASVANGDMSSPTLSDDGVFVSYPCQVYKFDPFTGAPLWHYNGGCSGGGGKTAAYSGDLLYVRQTTSNPTGTIFHADNGSIIRNFGGWGIVPIPAFGAAAGFFQMYGTLQGVDPATMQVNWSFAGDGRLVSAPIVIDQVVIVGSSSGNVYALDAASGSQVWSGSAGAAISGPDEQNYSAPLTGLGAGEGYLIVPAGNTLSAWRIVE